MRFELERAIA